MSMMDFQWRLNANTLLSALDAIILRLTAPGDACGVENRRRRLFLFSSLLGPLLALQVPIGLWLLDVAPDRRLIILALSIGSFWLLPILLWALPRRYDLVTSAAIANLNFAVLWAAFHYGGFSSPFLLWYFLVPMLGFFCLGSGPKARAKVIGSMATGIGLFAAASFWLEPGPDALADSDLMIMGVISLASSSIFIIVFALYYGRIIESHSDLIAEIRRHEETALDLRRMQENAERVAHAVSAQNRQLEAARSHLEFSALHDALTNLPNRRYFNQEMAKLTADPSVEAALTAILMIDLDRFKPINDAFGHYAGDNVLLTAAHRIQRCVTASDFVARIGGDEFVIICRACSSEEQVATLAQRIIQAMSEPILFGRSTLRVAASIGVACKSRHSLGNNLWVEADIALRHAKNRGSNRVEFFDQTLQTTLVYRNEIAADLIPAFESQQFIVFYQPQVDARSRQIIGAEALVRWQHPVRGLLAPPAFLPIAEDLNLLSKIDSYVFDRVLEDLAFWQSECGYQGRVSINVAARTLLDDTLGQKLRETKVSPHTLTFELVETIFFDEVCQDLAAAVANIKALGIEIEIDDFGTGYASIVGLLKLSPTRLKIDRQFVQPLIDAPEERRLLTSIIEMGRSLNIGIVAEGVETERQAAILTSLGCEILQGYGTGRPVPADAFAALLRKSP